MRRTSFTACRAPDARCWIFGHVGDGNLHVNVIGPPAGDATADDAVLDLVIAMGGSISAEHGIGIARREWLPIQCGKQAFEKGFMLERAEEGFATLDEVADSIAAYQPHRERPTNLDGLRKNLRLGEDGRWRWHWDRA